VNDNVEEVVDPRIEIFQCPSRRHSRCASFVQKLHCVGSTGGETFLEGALGNDYGSRLSGTPGSWGDFDFYVKRRVPHEDGISGHHSPELRILGFILTLEAISNKKELDGLRAADTLLNVPVGKGVSFARHEALLPALGGFCKWLPVHDGNP